MYRRQLGGKSSYHTGSSPDFASNRRYIGVDHGEGTAAGLKRGIAPWRSAAVRASNDQNSAGGQKDTARHARWPISAEMAQAGGRVGPSAFVAKHRVLATVLYLGRAESGMAFGAVHVGPGYYFNILMFVFEWKHAPVGASLFRAPLMKFC